MGYSIGLNSLSLNKDSQRASYGGLQVSAIGLGALCRKNSGTELGWSRAVVG